MPTPVIAPGAHIELRDAIWRVERVDPTSTNHHAWHCKGVSEIVRDQPAIFLSEYEPEVRVLDPRKTNLVRDTSSQHRAGLLYIEALLRDVPPPDDGLYIGHKAAMDVLDFQLDPAWRCLQKPRSRILIADAVGLGKTLEAGILLSELIRRGRARRILVATTRSMLTQFQKEMWARFTIPLVRLDSVGLQRIRSEIPTHHNPFYYFDKAIISIDTLKQNNWFRVHVEKAHWDVIVIDEAHNVARRGGGGSMRARIATVLGRSCDHLILLSATPHDGRSESFASLMNMLDPTAIADPSDYGPDDIRGLYVRRFKKDVRAQLAQHIPERSIDKCRATATPAEEAAYDVLTSLRLGELDKSQSGGMLYRTGLEKALFSSPAACLSNLRAPLRRTRVSNGIPPAVRRQLLDPAQTATSEALERAASYLPNDPIAPDLLALRDLAVAVEAIDRDRFSKYLRLLRLLGEMGWKASRARQDRLVIFTERRDTLLWLAEHLPRDLGLLPGQLEILHGTLADTEQQRIVEAFGKDNDKVRVLVASDVASEGINLHYLSHRMIHFDVPWSLMVFQQRNGRIDRYGQTRRPQIAYMVTDAANDRIRGDGRILELLIDKDEQANRNIGDPSAFMNKHNVEDEEALTAAAIEGGTSADDFGAELDANLDDPFAFLLSEGAEDALAGLSAAPRKDAPSLFGSDFEFARAGLGWLQADRDLKVEVDEGKGLIELSWPDDLRRRYRKLPTEVRPADGVVVLTADTARMQQASEEARGEAKSDEDAWPRHQLLWANSPVVHWLVDRARAAFGRHSAPVLVKPSLGAGTDAAVVVSGVLSNRRGRALVHRWYVACFAGGRLHRVLPFAEFQAAADLRGDGIPNSADEVDVQGLVKLLATAIDRVEVQVMNDRRAFELQSSDKIDGQRERLQELRQQRLAVLDTRYAGKPGPREAADLARQRRELDRLFDEHEGWIADAMTASRTPFLQVVAVLVTPSRGRS